MTAFARSHLFATGVLLASLVIGCGFPQESLGKWHGEPMEQPPQRVRLSFRAP